jgi:hypothetical protein
VDVELEILSKNRRPALASCARGQLSQKFDEVLNSHLSRVGVALSKADRKNLRAALDERLAQLGLPSETSVDVHRIANELTSTALRAINEFRRTWDVPDPATLAPLETELGDAVRLAFLNLRIPPPRLMVLVTTSEIREAGTAENITRLHLKVSEQGVEWATVESEGVPRESVRSNIRIQVEEIENLLLPGLVQQQRIRVKCWNMVTVQFVANRLYQAGKIFYEQPLLHKGSDTH